MLYAALETGLSKEECLPRPEPSQTGTLDSHALAISQIPPINLALGQLLTQVNDDAFPETCATYNQFTNASNEQLQFSIADSSAVGSPEIQNDSHSEPAMDSQVEAPIEIEQGGSLSSHDILPQDGWYNPCFTGAGVEQFAGLNPYTLFQQGWRTFG